MIEKARSCILFAINLPYAGWATTDGYAYTKVQAQSKLSIHNGSTDVKSYFDKLCLSAPAYISLLTVTTTSLSQALDRFMYSRVVCTSLVDLQIPDAQDNQNKLQESPTAISIWINTCIRIGRFSTWKFFAGLTSSRQVCRYLMALGQSWDSHMTEAITIQHPLEEARSRQKLEYLWVQDRIRKQQSVNTDWNSRVTWRNSIRVEAWKFSRPELTEGQSEMSANTWQDRRTVCKSKSTRRTSSLDIFESRIDSGQSEYLPESNKAPIRFAFQRVTWRSSIIFEARVEWKANYNICK